MKQQIKKDVEWNEWKKKVHEINYSSMLVRPDFIAYFRDYLDKDGNVIKSRETSQGEYDRYAEDSEFRKLCKAGKEETNENI